METRAYLKGTRLSPQKAALVADQIRGKSVDEAMDFLVYNKQKGSAVIKKLLESGMYIGSHGYSHSWLNKLNYQDQKKDIKKSLNFLKEIGAPTKNWIMCYPYGAFNNNTISILKETNCSYAFACNPAVADLKKDKFKLPRMDTNYFPQ